MKQVKRKSKITSIFKAFLISLLITSVFVQMVGSRVLANPITPPITPPVTITPTPTPEETPTPVPALNPISWKTSTVSLEADDFYILADGQKYYGKASDLAVRSDPGSNTYTTLEAIWHENGKEMRLFMYFSANGTYWWSPEIRTYNGKEPGDWLTYTGGQFFKNYLGYQYKAPNWNLYHDMNNPYLNSIHFTNLKIQAFTNWSVPTATPTPTYTPTPTSSPTPTPTPTSTQSKYTSYGPKGTPSSDWDTASEFLGRLNNLGYQASQLLRYDTVNGIYQTYNYGLPYGDFNLQAGEGYLIYGGNLSEGFDSSFTYANVNSFTYNLAKGYTFISFPKQLIEGNPLLKDAQSAVSDMNKNGAYVTQMLDWNGETNTYTAYEPGNPFSQNFTLESGKGYLILSNNAFSWNIATVIPTATPTPIPAPVNNNPVVYPKQNFLPGASTGRNYSTNLWIVDADRDSVEVSISGLPNGLSYNCRDLFSSTVKLCTISGRPEKAGLKTVSVQATDSRGGITYKNYLLFTSSKLFWWL